MRKLIAAAAVTAALSLTACGPSSPSAAPAAAASSRTAQAAAARPAPPAALGQLTLARFPSTSSGKEARGICETWQKLRREYAGRLAADSPYQLNQWFSGPDWHKSWEDGAALGNDPAYSNLEVAYGTATVGDEAGAATIKQMDEACAKGD